MPDVADVVTGPDRAGQPGSPVRWDGWGVRGSQRHGNRMKSRKPPI
ncbi:hypothetical protein T261_6285 [Streptomyces lydicus]|nr:hypothetical protein T261_6285 [Streptomyces lydicus]